MVSFIVIGKNEGERLVRCIKSIYNFVLQESIKDYEIIYVDSMSSDNSISNALILKVDKVYLITGTCNAAIARNIGSIESKGDILFFIDGDIELIPGFFSSIVNITDGQMFYPFVRGNCMDILHDSNWNFIEKRKILGKSQIHDTFEITTGGIFCISKILWERVGGMDSRLKYNEDFDLGVRMDKIGYPVCRKPQIWFNHYTRYHITRPGEGDYPKYRAMFIRKHFFNPKVQKRMALPMCYNWFLFLCIVLCFIIPIYIPLFLYIITVIYRDFRISQTTKEKINLCALFFKIIKDDFLFWWSFLTFYPRKSKYMYQRIESS